MRSTNIAISAWTEEIGRCGQRVKYLEGWYSCFLRTILVYVCCFSIRLVKWIIACLFILKIFPIWISYMTTLRIFKFMNFNVVRVLVSTEWDYGDVLIRRLEQRIIGKEMVRNRGSKMSSILMLSPQEWWEKGSCSDFNKWENFKVGWI